MKAVTLAVSVPRYLLVKAFGGLTSSVTFGGLSGLRLGEVPSPAIPAPDWLRLDVILCGICGTDLGNLTFSASPILEPFASFPAVLGHEVLAQVAEVGSEVRGFEVGQRVAVQPTISCTVRGYKDYQCPSCAAGLTATCEQAGEAGPMEIGGRLLSPGLTIGYHQDLPGGWGEQIIAHQSQLFPVTSALEDREAVLIEPLSIGVHAVLQAPPHPDEPVLVIGSGPIAMATIWTLRALGFQGDLVAQAKRRREVELAKRLGATEVVTPGAEARQALVDTGSMAYQPLVGQEVYAGGGFPLIYDCVGTANSLDQAIRYATPRGRIVMLGCSAQVRKLDLTFLWARELEIRGFMGYGRERWEGRDLHTFEITQELLARTPVPIDRMVTHIFPLEQYRDALKAAGNRRRSGAMKVVLQP
jgi:threonine dehydrogenase-like Zn-dependent dehydrogenase